MNLVSSGRKQIPDELVIVHVARLLHTFHLVSSIFLLSTDVSSLKLLIVPFIKLLDSDADHRSKHGLFLSALFPVPTSDLNLIE